MVTQTQIKQSWFSRHIFGKKISSSSYEKALTKLVNDETERRSQILQSNGIDSNIIELPWDYASLVNWAKGNAVLRTVHEAIIKECTRNRWDIKPKWMRKCPVCGNEFQAEVEYCPDCQHEGNYKSVATVKPDINQRQTLKAFLEDPNSDDEMSDIVVSALRYMLAVDDWYLSIQYPNRKEFKPFTIYNEDSVYMRVCADKHGSLGNNEWFCPLDTEHPERTFPNKNGVCPDHPDQELVETAYIYLASTRARFAKKEILHGIPNPWKPSLYGVSREISCLRILMSLAAMDENNFQIYDEGQLGNILCFQGINQPELNALAAEAEKQKHIVKTDPKTGRKFIKKIRTLFFASPNGPVTNTPAMPDSEKMQSLDWYKIWKTIVCSVYGVQDVFAGNSEPGTTGQNPRMKVDVNNNTTEFWQKAFEDPFNNIIVNQGLGVTDWLFKFNPVEEKDEAQDQAILTAKLTNIQMAISLGMDAELTDEQEVKLSGQPLSLEEKNQMALDKFKQQSQMMGANQEQSQGQDKQKQGDAAFNAKQPFQKENVFPTQKAKEKWLVEKIKEGD
jgi:hypothetical protein